MANDQPESGLWTFLSNHTHVLVCLAADGDQILREVAQKVGITERAVQRIVADLEQAGVLHRERDARDARRNRYRINTEMRLRHPLEAHCRIGALLDSVTPPAGGPESRPTATVERVRRRALTSASERR